MDHSRSRTLIAKDQLKKDISMPVAIEKDLCRQAKQSKIMKIMLMAPGKYSMADLRKKNLSRIEELYDKELRRKGLI